MERSNEHILFVKLHQHPLICRICRDYVCAKGLNMMLSTLKHSYCCGPLAVRTVKCLLALCTAVFYSVYYRIAVSFIAIKVNIEIDTKPKYEYTF